MSLSATNAAGGTRVIGVGCRYYTTLRRGVFISACVASSNASRRRSGTDGSHRELDRRT
nr:MAG TPA: hypothetical protein [Bacteriophage sp.]